MEHLEPVASGVPERRKVDGADVPENTVAATENLQDRRSRAAEVLEAKTRRKAVKDEAPRSRSSSTSERTRIMLRKQKDLDAAAAKAEEAAENARAFAHKVAEEERHRDEVDDSFDWEEDKGPSALGRLAVTSFGAGKVYLSVIDFCGG
eukprot:symbB.v1.2.002161.t1/scaffold116.1/size325063/18